MSQENFILIEQSLSSVKFPATKAELINKVSQQKDVDSSAISILRRLPDQKFDSVAAVKKAISAIEVGH